MTSRTADVERTVTGTARLRLNNIVVFATSSAAHTHTHTHTHTQHDVRCAIKFLLLFRTGLSALGQKDRNEHWPCRGARLFIVFSLSS